MNINNVKLKKDHYSLVFSNLFLHLTDNIENYLNSIFNSLNSNGFFIAIIPDKNCMYQLLNCMYESDLHIYKGVYPRFNPTLEINNILEILKMLKFSHPSIHTDIIEIKYTKFDKLIKDVKKMNISYCYKDKKQNFEKKTYFDTLEKFYKKSYYDGAYNLEVKVNIISGWKN